jgi:hypothetical protein
MWSRTRTIRIPSSSDLMWEDTTWKGPRVGKGWWRMYGFERGWKMARTRTRRIHEGGPPSRESSGRTPRIRPPLPRTRKVGRHPAAAAPAVPPAEGHPPTSPARPAGDTSPPGSTTPTGAWECPIPRVATHHPLDCLDRCPSHPTGGPRQPRRAPTSIRPLPSTTHPRRARRVSRCRAAPTDLRRPRGPGMISEDTAHTAEAISSHPNRRRRSRRRTGVRSRLPTTITLLTEANLADPNRGRRNAIGRIAGREAVLRRMPRRMSSGGYWERGRWRGWWIFWMGWVRFDFWFWFWIWYNLA